MKLDTVIHKNESHRTLRLWDSF